MHVDADPRQNPSDPGTGLVGARVGLAGPREPAAVPPPPTDTSGIGAAATSPAGADASRRPSGWRPWIVPQHGVVAGVAAGLGHRFGVPLAAVRLALFVTSFAGGAGALAYVALSLTGRTIDPPGPPPSGVVAQRKAVAMVPMLVGVLVGLRELGLWFGDGLVWPITLAGLGALVIGSREDERADPAAASDALGPLSRVLMAEDDSRRRTVVRVAAGALLVAVGMALFLASTDTLSALAAVAPAVAVLLSGAALIAGPLVYRLVHQLADERRDRIRTQERADLAAHLHDSVLQTLALIQRSRDPREMATLARGQERELRTWLYGEAVEDDDAVRLRDAVDEVAGRAEQRWRVAVNHVVVGDAEVDEPLRALLEATAEAVTNAGKHSGVDQVSIYVEVEPDAVTAFVRDEGRGFDPAEVGEDRRGIADSIRGRLTRHGGRADLTAEPGSGTEWLLQVPRET